MPKKQDWLDIMEEASDLKKGTKIPKNVDIYTLTMLINRPPAQGNGSMAPFGTGAGANGIIEPQKAVAIDLGTKPASVYHEGETVYPFPGGKNIVPAKTEEQQQNISGIQKKMNLPGFQTGGTVYEDPNSLTQNIVTRPTNTYDLTPQASTYQSGVNQAFQTTQQRATGTDPLMQNITNKALQSYDTRAAVSDTATRQSLASNPYLTEGAKRAVTAKQQATYSAGLSGLVGDLSEQSMQRAEEANQQLYTMGRTGVQDELAKAQWQKTFGEQQYQSDVARQQWQEEYEASKDKWQKAFDFEKQKYGDQEFARMSDDAQTTSLQTWLQKYPNASEADYNTAREYKTLQLSGMGIANATASETLTQLQKSSKWSDAQQFLSAGDYNNYRALVKEITGRDISTADYEADRQYLTQMRGLESESVQIQNDAARFNLTTATMQAMISDINNGVPLNTINATYNPQPPLTNEDYSSISTKYRQTITSGSLALQAQGIANDAALLGISADRLTTFVNAVNSGADLAAANQASGLNLSQVQMDSIAEKYRQTIQAGELQLTNAQIVNEAAALGVSADRLNAFITAVNNGADLAAANATSGLNLTQSQMDGIATKYQQAIAAGEQALEAGELANDATRLGISTDRLNSFINAVNSGADLTAANSTSGLNLTQDQMDGIATKYRQGIEATELALAATKNELGDQMYQSVIDMINAGSSLKTINNRLFEQGKRGITQDEFESMYNASALGERNWGRDLTAANMLLTTPGAGNKLEAEVAYGNLFPGVTFDFTDVISEERYEDFADGLSLLASYVSSGLKFEEAYGLIQAGGVADKMGADAAQLKNLYHAMEVNAIDSEWNEMENSDFYKGLSSDEQNELQEFFKQSMLGQLDYTAMHEYEIYNPDGTLNMTIYSKDSTEADKKAAALGEGYTVKDTNKIKFQVASTITSTNVTSTGKETTPEAALSQIKKEGGDYTIDDVATFQEQKGYLPESKAEIDAWDTANQDTALWNNLESKYAGGILATQGNLPTATNDDLKDIVAAKTSGDARADQYYANPGSASAIFPQGSTMDQALATWFSGINQKVTNGDAGGYQKNVPENIITAVNDNIGKLITASDGKNYVILGMKNIDISKENSYSGKAISNVGGIEVYNVDTGEREVISPYNDKRIGFMTSQVIKKGLANNLDDAVKINDYSNKNDVSLEDAKTALGL